MANLTRNASPSDNAAEGGENLGRQFILSFSLDSAVAANLDGGAIPGSFLQRHVVKRRCGIRAANGFRANAGAAGGTLIQVQRDPLNAGAPVDVLTSQLAFVQASGANLTADSLVDVGHADYDAATGLIICEPGDVVSVIMDAGEGVGTAGLAISVQCEWL